MKSSPHGGHGHSANASVPACTGSRRTIEMSNVPMRARDIEALALSTLTVKDDSVAQGNRRRGGASFVRVVLTATSAVALLWLLVANTAPSSASHWNGDSQGPSAPAAVKESAKLPPTMEIIPAPVSDAGVAVFTGAGDGSNGTWFRR
jgi:hypothetical protein